MKRVPIPRGNPDHGHSSTMNRSTPLETTWMETNKSITKSPKLRKMKNTAFRILAIVCLTLGLYSCAVSREGGSEVLQHKDSDEKAVEHIKFSPEKKGIESISLSSRSLNMKFHDFRNKGDIYYAEKTVLKGTEINRDMTIIRKDIIFNTNIPDEIFTLKKPRSFELLYFGNM